ncbi:MAG: hypothetical protein AAB257_04140 [Nitrospinota bacterium]
MGFLDLLSTRNAKKDGHPEIHALCVEIESVVKKLKRDLKGMERL